MAEIAVLGSQLLLLWQNQIFLAKNILPCKHFEAPLTIHCK